MLLQAKSASARREEWEKLAVALACLCFISKPSACEVPWMDVCEFPFDELHCMEVLLP